MTDAFKTYETGLTRLLEQLNSNHPRYSEVLALEAQLRENINQARLDGDNENRRTDRNRILRQLNLLALEMVQVSFNELCGTDFTPATAEETLIIIAPFAGGLSNLEVTPHWYIRDTLYERINRLDMVVDPVRVETLMEPLVNQCAAHTTGKNYKAALVIWGEFDDVGIRIFVEIMDDVPQPDIQQSGNRLPIGVLPSTQDELNILHERLVKDLPRQADYLVTLSLGIIQLVQQHIDKAEQLFTQAIELTQTKRTNQIDAHQAYYRRGLAHNLREHFPEALADLTQSLTLNPKFKLALVQRGGVYLAIGLANAAQDDFKAALALTCPEDRASRAILLGNIGLTFERQGDFEQARAYYEQARQINHEKEDVIAQVLDLERYGSLYQRQRQFEVAFDCYTKALMLCRQENSEQERAQILGNIGLIHYEQRNLDAALEFYRKSLAIYKAIGNALGQAKQMVQIGLVYLDQHDLDTARNLFDQALDTYQVAGSLYGQARSWIGIGLIENQSGNKVSALSSLRTALRLFEVIESPDADIVRQEIQKLQV